MPGQDLQDRPDTVALVFRLKVQKLLEMLKSEMVFGKPQVWLYSIVCAACWALGGRQLLAERTECRQAPSEWYPVS